MPAKTTPYDHIIGQIVGENTNLVDGIAGGVESLPDNRFNAPSAERNEGEETPDPIVTADDIGTAWDMSELLGDSESLTATLRPTPSTSAYRTSTPAPSPEPSTYTCTSYPHADTPTSAQRRKKKKNE
eukprot:TRINITY_DN31506_c0_g1_i10.p1 TRINITY_DN31506_c0_g1~~TRINITY_DN31506_c0_g1_i10.p1  ORF type:complete len:128 (+),score=24.40 TRINITY_DN31506_c0_g1_i10:611-994(+)